jgi:DNA gyrase/topoisomerase IV subunit A
LQQQLALSRLASSHLSGSGAEHFPAPSHALGWVVQHPRAPHASHGTQLHKCLQAAFFESVLALARKGYGHRGVVNRGVAEIVENKNEQFQIIITEIPYRVVKDQFIENIAELVQEKKIEGIKGLRDESAKDIRIVIDLKNGAHPQKVLNCLYKHTELEKTFHFNIVALVDGVPQTLSLRDCLSEFIKHRQEVVRRRSEYELKQAKARCAQETR